MEGNHEDDNASRTSLSLLDFDSDSDDMSACSGFSVFSKTSHTSIGSSQTGRSKSSGKGKKSKRKKSGGTKGWSIFKSLVGGGSKKEAKDGIPSSITA